MRMMAVLLFAALAFFASALAMCKPIWNPSVVKYSRPDLPVEFDRQFTYLSKRKKGQQETDDGPTVYFRFHRLAWGDCLKSFYYGWMHDSETAEWEVRGVEAHIMAPWIVGAPPHINDARRDGWNKCADQLREQLKIVSADEIRGRLSKTRWPLAVALAMLGVLCFAISIRKWMKHDSSLP